MGFLDSIKSMFGKAQGRLPENLSSIDEVKARAQALAQEKLNDFSQK